jgi:hypothetical protein
MGIRSSSAVKYRRLAFIAFLWWAVQSGQFFAWVR